MPAGTTLGAGIGREILAIGRPKKSRFPFGAFVARDGFVAVMGLRFSLSWSVARSGREEVEVSASARALLASLARDA